MKQNNQHNTGGTHNFELYMCPWKVKYPQSLIQFSAYGRKIAYGLVIFLRTMIKI